MSEPEFTVINNFHEKNEIIIDATNFKEAAGFFIDWLKKLNEFKKVTCIGHRIVHGMKHTLAEIINEDLFNELDKISGYNPVENPRKLTPSSQKT